MSQKSLGRLQIILSGICFGFLGVFGKWAYSLNLRPLEFLSLRFLVASFLLLSITKVMKLKVIPEKKQLIYCSILGILGYALFSGLYFITLSMSSASLTVLLLYIYPFFVVILEFFLLKEKTHPSIFLLLFFASIGLYLLIANDLSYSSPWAFVTGLGSAFFYSIYILLNHKWLKNISGLVATGWIQFFAGVALFIISFSHTERLEIFTASIIPPIMGAAIICSVMAMSLFTLGLQKITSSETSLLSLTEPLSAIILATFILKEEMNIQQIIGGVIIILCLMTLHRSPIKKISDIT
jgi:drug/metabolite transporter (DMT)-like permease